MAPHEPTDTQSQPPADVSAIESEAAPTSETPATSCGLNWEALDPIHTYQDADGNLIIPAAWRDEGDDEDDNLYT